MNWYGDQLDFQQGRLDMVFSGPENNAFDHVEI